MRSCISDHVGSVKHFLGALQRALRKKRHFALIEGLPFPTVGSLLIVSGLDSVRPMHLFGHNSDHDYKFRLPGVGEQDAQSVGRCSTAHHCSFRAVPRANRTF